jgi:hypothetical protein
MQFFERLRKWWKLLRDPADKARRAEQKKAEEMARRLDRNQQAGSGQNQ